MIRWVLPELSWPDYEAVAKELQLAMTDAVIAQAVGRMPESYQKLSAEKISGYLKARRARLPEIARDFYEYLAEDVDIQGTDRAEQFIVEADDGETVLIRILRDEEEVFSRRFDDDDTDDIRIHLRGGADTVECKGRVGRQMNVRIIFGLAVTQDVRVPSQLPQPRVQTVHGDCVAPAPRKSLCRSSRILIHRPRVNVNTESRQYHTRLGQGHLPL